MENVGMMDRMIRFVVAIVFIVIGFTVSAWWFIVAAYALLTALTGWCGIYTYLHYNTYRVTEGEPHSSKKSAKKR